MDCVIKTLLTAGQLEWLVPGVAVAEESTAAAYFGSESGHIVIRHPSSDSSKRSAG